MKPQRTRQIVLGVITGILAVALAALVAHLTGVRTGNAEAVGAPPPATPLPAASGEVAAGFSALSDSSLRAAPQSAIVSLQSMHSGTYADAKAVQDGMYLATNNGALCAWVVGGFGQCTDRLNYGDVWLQGTEQRHYDSDSAPFDVHVYGFARDGISSIDVTTKGATQSIPVVNNAFRATLDSTSFSDIVSVVKVYASGEKSPMETANQFHSPADTQTKTP